MIHFKEMFKCFKENGTKKIKGVVRSDDVLFLSYFEQCEVFTFRSSGVVTHSEHINDLIAAPFPVFSVEMIGGGNYIMNDDGYATACIMVTDSYFMLYVKRSDGHRDVICVEVENKAASYDIRDIVNSLLTRIGNEHVGAIETNQILNYKNPKNPKKKKTIIKNHMFIVSPTKYKQTDNNVKIVWTHRWSVRGHWRNIHGIGKDQNGDYTIEGKTWVSSFKKGPEDKLMVKKQRIVKG